MRCSKYGECDPPQNSFLANGFKLGVFLKKRPLEEPAGECRKKSPRAVCHCHHNPQGKKTTAVAHPWTPTAGHLFSPCDMDNGVAGSGSAPASDSDTGTLQPKRLLEGAGSVGHTKTQKK